jgi:DivIVA domain-containing protein
VRRARFTATKFRTGYDQDGVDDFLDRLAAALESGR